MDLPPMSGKDSESKEHTYSRKQKSLGLLCSNFLSLCDRDGLETIGIDDAASRLGCERRRMYDIFNVLEVVGVLAKNAKNMFCWKGIGAIPKTLQELKEQDPKENCERFDSEIVRVADDDEDEQVSDQDPSCQKAKLSQDSLHKTSATSRTDYRREKSLGFLAQQFVKLFLRTTADMITLDEAAKILLGDAPDPSTTRTKVRRRLYDIANLLSSVNLIEKTRHPETRKPAFRWLGRGGQLHSDSATALASNDSKKRSFGTILSNACCKRSKLVSIDDVDQIMKPESHTQVLRAHSENKVNGKILQHGSGQDSKKYQFGPFAPVSVYKPVKQQVHEFGPSAPPVNVHKPVKKVNDREILPSTYGPQFHSQALKDLYAQYKEARKSWYSQVAVKDPKFKPLSSLSLIR